MASAVLERVEHHAARAARNLPVAHAVWQFWRSSAFRTEVNGVIGVLYSINADQLNDDQLQRAEDITRTVIRLIEVQMARFGAQPADECDRTFCKEALGKLREGAKGLEQGLSPDPAKRPSRAEMLDRFAAGLQRANIG